MSIRSKVMISTVCLLCCLLGFVAAVYAIRLHRTNHISLRMGECYRALVMRDYDAAIDAVGQMRSDGWPQAWVDGFVDLFWQAVGTTGVTPQLGKPHCGAIPDDVLLTGLARVIHRDVATSRVLKALNYSTLADGLFASREEVEKVRILVAYHSIYTDAWMATRLLRQLKHMTSSSLQWMSPGPAGVLLAAAGRYGEVIQLRSEVLPELPERLDPLLEDLLGAELLSRRELVPFHINFAGFSRPWAA